MNDLLKQMAQDAGNTAQDNMGKIGAVANDIADTDKEISDIEDKLKKKKDYKKHLSENVLPNLFAEVGLAELKLADGRHLKVLLPDNKQIILSSGPLTHKLMKELKDFNDNDYLLLIGDPAIIALAGAIVSNVNNGRFKVLKWDRDEKKYYDLEIDLRGRNE